MEQKTEASQAVDLPVLPHLPRAVGYRHTMDNTEGIKGNKPQIYFSSTKPAPFGIPGLDYSASFPVTTEALFTADQMKEYARAALKAQPAPTDPILERAQSSGGFVSFTHYDATMSDDEVIAKFMGQPAPTETQGDLRERVIAVMEAERVDDTGTDGDTAYNSAINHCIDAVNGLFTPAQIEAQGEDSARLDFFAPVVLNPLCACAKCNPSAVGRMMILCAICGNKRCPHAADHGFVCTSSNEPGQVGVPYEIDRARASAETGGVK